MSYLQGKHKFIMEYASTLSVQGDPTKTDIDTGFWVYNPGTWSNLPIFYGEVGQVVYRVRGSIVCSALGKLLYLQPLKVVGKGGITCTWTVRIVTDLNHEVQCETIIRPTKER